jgi:hypothetical protein
MGSSSSNNWYALDFGEIRNVSSVKLFFYADGKTFEKPDEYDLEYWNGRQWLPVKVKDRTPSLPIGNTVNKVSFDKIATTQLRINFKNEEKSYAIALTEIEMY